MSKLSLLIAIIVIANVTNAQSTPVVFIEIEQEPSSVWEGYLSAATSLFTTRLFEDLSASESTTSISTLIASPLPSSTSPLSFPVSLSSTYALSIPTSAANIFLSASSLSSTIGSVSLSVSESDVSTFVTNSNVFPFSSSSLSFAVPSSSTEQTTSIYTQGGSTSSTSLVSYTTAVPSESSPKIPTTTENGSSLVFSSTQSLPSMTLGETSSFSSSFVEVQYSTSTLESLSSIGLGYSRSSQLLVVTGTQKSSFLSVVATSSSEISSIIGTEYTNGSESIQTTGSAKPYLSTTGSYISSTSETILTPYFSTSQEAYPSTLLPTASSSYMLNNLAVSSALSLQTINSAEVPVSSTSLQPLYPELTSNAFLPSSSSYVAYKFSSAAEVSTSFSLIVSTPISTLPFSSNEAVHSSQISALLSLPKSVSPKTTVAASGNSGWQSTTIPSPFVSSAGFTPYSTITQSVPSGPGTSPSSELSTSPTYQLPTSTTGYLSYTSASSDFEPFSSSNVLFSTSISTQSLPYPYFTSGKSQLSAFPLSSSASSIAWSSYYEVVSTTSASTISSSENESFTSGAASSTLLSLQSPYSSTSTSFSISSFVSSYPHFEASSVSTSTPSYYTQASLDSPQSSSYPLSSYLPTSLSVENSISTSALPSLPLSSRYSDLSTTATSYYENPESSPPPSSSYAFSSYLSAVSSGENFVFTPTPSFVSSSGVYSFGLTSTAVSSQESESISSGLPSEPPNIFTIATSRTFLTYTSTPSIYTSTPSAVGSSGFSTQEFQTTSSISSELGFSSTSSSELASSQLFLTSTSALAAYTSISSRSTYTFSSGSTSEIKTTLSTSTSFNYGETIYSASLVNTLGLIASTRLSVTTSSAVTINNGLYATSYSSELPSSSNVLGTVSSDILEASPSSIEPSVGSSSSVGTPVYTASTPESTLSETIPQSSTSYSQSFLSIPTAHFSGYSFAVESSTAERVFSTSSFKISSIAPSTYVLGENSYTSLEKTTLGESTSSNIGAFVSSTGFFATYTTESSSLPSGTSLLYIPSSTEAQYSIYESSVSQTSAESTDLGISSTVGSVSTAFASSVIFSSSTIPHLAAMSSLSNVLSTVASTSAIYQASTVPSTSVEYQLSASPSHSITYELPASASAREHYQSSSSSEYSAQLSFTFVSASSTILATTTQFSEYSVQPTSASVLSTLLSAQSSEYLAQSLSTAVSSTVQPSAFASRSSFIPVYPTSLTSSSIQALNSEIASQSFMGFSTEITLSEQASNYLSATSATTTIKSPLMTPSANLAVSVAGESSTSYTSAQNTESSEQSPPSSFTLLVESSSISTASAFQSSNPQQSEPTSSMSQQASFSSANVASSSTPSSESSSPTSLTSSPIESSGEVSVSTVVNPGETSSRSRSVVSPTSTIVASYLGYVDLGCFPDPSADGGPLGQGAALSHAFPGSPYSDSMDSCLAQCATTHSRYAGLEPGVCYCADSILLATLAPGRCKLTSPLRRRGNIYVYIEIFENQGIPEVTMIFENPSTKSVFQTIYTGASLMATSTRGFDSFVYTQYDESSITLPQTTNTALESLHSSPPQLMHSTINSGIITTIIAPTSLPSTIYFPTATIAVSLSALASYADLSYFSYFGNPSTSEVIPTFISAFDILTVSAEEATATFVVVEPTYSESIALYTEKAAITSVTESVLAEPAPTGTTIVENCATETGTIKAALTTETAGIEAAFTTDTGTTELAGIEAALTTGTVTAEAALATETAGREVGAPTGTAAISSLTESVSAVTATLTYEASPSTTSAVEQDSEGGATEVDASLLATPTLSFMTIASTVTASLVSYPSHVSCQVAFPPSSTPNSIGLATFAITPYNPNDQRTQYFGFGPGAEHGSEAITAETSIANDELLFYRFERSILPWDGYCDAGLGYYYHGITGLCVTVSQTAQKYPKFQSGNYYLDFCDTCNDGTPPLSQLFCLNSADCLTFSGDVPLARESFYGLNGYDNLVGASVLNAGDCIMYTEGNLETDH